MISTRTLRIAHACAGLGCQRGLPARNIAYCEFRAVFRVTTIAVGRLEDLERRGWSARRIERPQEPGHTERTVRVFLLHEQFPPTAIEKWCDEDSTGEGQTALCPRCEIDSVIGSASGYPITREFLGVDESSLVLTTRREITMAIRGRTHRRTRARGIASARVAGTPLHSTLK